MNNRKGILKISKAFIDNAPESIMEIMAKLIVLRCEYLATYDVYEYHVISPLLDEVETGQIVPEYTLTIGPDGVKASKVA